MKINKIAIVSFLSCVLSLSFAEEKAAVETKLIKVVDWYSITMPVSVVPGETIEAQVHYKNLKDTFINFNLGKKTRRGGGYLAAGKAIGKGVSKAGGIKVSGTGTQLFTVKVPEKNGLIGIVPLVWQSTKGDWKSKTVAKSPRKHIPIIYPKALTRPAADWHTKVESKTSKATDWCEIITPTVAAIGKRMDVTVKYKGLEETNLVCVLYYVLEDGTEGYLSSAVQAPEKVSGDGEKTFWLAVRKEFKDLKTVKVLVYLSEEGNWRTKTKETKSETISVQVAK